jgi:hypothetical protein
MADEPQTEIKEPTPDTSVVDIEVEKVAKDYASRDLLTRSYDDSGLTISIAGTSYSGKTYLTVEMLNFLKNKRRGGPRSDPLRGRRIYEKIYLFTTSPGAQPLKGLKLSKDEFQLITGYIPKIIHLIKRIQDVTENRLAWLFIFDDMIQYIRNFDTTALFLTLRNANISTVALNQMYNALSPGARRSAHIVLVTKLTTEDWIQIIEDGFKDEIEKILDVTEKDLRIRQLARLMGRFTGSDVCLLDNKRKRIQFLQRDPFVT